jgi:hypothetical protein
MSQEAVETQPALGIPTFPKCTEGGSSLVEIGSEEGTKDGPARRVALCEVITSVAPPLRPAIHGVAFPTGCWTGKV